MSSTFSVRPTMDVLTNSDFLGAGSIARATADRLTSRIFPDPSMVVSSTTSERAGGGIRISHTTTFPGLQQTSTVSHRFHFIDRMETRERFHVVSPQEPSVTTELLVAFDDGQSRDYFSISTYDSDGMIAATDTLVYNDEGKIVTYPFGDALVSPLTVTDAHLREVTTDSGARELEFGVELDGLAEDTEIALLWEAIGSIERVHRRCGPGRTSAAIRMPLEDNTTAYPCDWVAIAVDDQERVLAQAHFALMPQ